MSIPNSTQLPNWLSWGNTQTPILFNHTGDCSTVSWNKNMGNMRVRSIGESGPISKQEESPMFAERAKLIPIFAVLLVLLAATAYAESTVTNFGQVGSIAPQYYFPLAEGNLWQYVKYEVVSDDLPPPPYTLSLSQAKVGADEYYSYEYSNEIITTEEINGVLTSLWLMGENDQIFALAQLSDGLYCYKIDENYLVEPMRMLKFPFTVGSTWIFGDGDTWGAKFTVQSVNDTVAVEAGVFTNCIRLKVQDYDEYVGIHRLDAGVQALDTDRYKLMWLAPFVGVVKEEYYEKGAGAAFEFYGVSRLLSFEVYIPDETAPPTPVVVDDGVISYGNSLHAKWTCEDPDSGIAGYRVAISTTPGETGILVLPDESTAEWEIPAINEATSPGVSLEEGQTYYILVKARNNAGLWSDWGVSDGIEVSLTPPNHDLLPLQVGNYWWYSVWDEEYGEDAPGHIEITGSSKVSTVTVYDVEKDISEPIPPVIAMGRAAAGYCEYKEDGVTITPPRLFLKLPAVQGDSWQTVAADAIGPYTVTHTIVSIKEVVETPAGTFTDCVKVENTNSAWPDEREDMWFAPGVGLVKQENYEGETLTKSIQLTGWHVYAGPPDTTPPSKPTVTLESPTGVIYGTTVAAGWSSTDAESGIAAYKAAVSATTTEAGIVQGTDWQSMGTDTEGSLDDLPLLNGQKYYLIVKAMNGAGLWSQVGASRSFTVEKAIGSIRISTTPVQEGEVFVAKAKGTLQFAATVYDEEDLPMTGKKVTWTCDANAGKITSAGKLTALCTPGFHIDCITATVAGSGVAASADVEIVPGDPWTVRVEPTSVTLECADPQQFTATVLDRCGNEIQDAEIIWSVRNASAGAISETGLFTAGSKPGRYTGSVVAMCGSKKGTAAVTVTAPPPTRVDIVPNLATVEVGKPKKFTAIGYDSLDRAIFGLKFVWSVSNEALGKIATPSGAFSAAKIPSSGFVYAQALINGAPAGDTGLAEVQVVPGAPNKVVITEPTATLVVSESRQFTAQLVDRYGNETENEVNWSWSCTNSKAGAFDPLNLGLFTAGTTPGSYGLCLSATATYAGGAKTGKAKLTITSASP